MIQEMVLRGLAPNTQRVYLQAVTRLARYYGRSPNRVSNRDVKAYLLHLHQDKKRATSSCNVASAALRFFYYRTLGPGSAKSRMTLATPGTLLPGSVC
jgi:site-specific recombinase XerD